MVQTSIFSFVNRALFFKYEKDRTVKDISLYRFSTTPELFANHSVNPDNGAFCNKEKCWGSGLLSVGQCQDGGRIQKF